MRMINSRKMKWVGHIVGNPEEEGSLQKPNINIKEYYT
jgi:hypothetical protein